MQSCVRLSVPAQAIYARTVRMMAANLAVVCELDVDEVEDVRMAAEEGFVYACATRPETCEVSFDLGPDEIVMDFSLGDDELEEEGDETDLDLALLLLAAVCDDCGLTDDGSALRIIKKVGVHAE